MAITNTACVTFDGTSGTTLTFPADADINNLWDTGDSDGCAYSFWVRITGGNTADRMLDKDEFSIRLNNNSGGSSGLFVTRVYGGSNYTFTSTSDSAISHNQWHHICVTYEGYSGGYGATVVYLDGAVLAGSEGTQTGFASDESGVDLHIMKRYNNSNYAVGSFDELSLYNQELSASEVAELYNGGNVLDLSAASFAGKMVFWARFEEGTGTSTSDEQGNVADGTLSTASMWTTDNLLPVPSSGYHKQYKRFADYTGFPLW